MGTSSGAPSERAIWICPQCGDQTEPGELCGGGYGAGRHAVAHPEPFVPLRDVVEALGSSVIASVFVPAEKIDSRGEV